VGKLGEAIQIIADYRGLSPIVLMGNVWEWTSTSFEPYPGFVPDPYRDYSAPWFGTRKVLRGGCWATCSRLLRTTWRNFFPPSATISLQGSAAVLCKGEGRSVLIDRRTVVRPSIYQSFASCKFSCDRHAYATFLSGNQSSSH
jgi:hypothetical protein